MKRLALAVVLATAACNRGGIPNPNGPDGGKNVHGDDAGEQTSGCMSDGECGSGQVCVNCSGVGACTPGCRADSQCGTREICQMGTICQTCPCPPGWCVIDPCRDEDGDGFVPGNDPTTTCPGKQKGDCNDRAPDVKPGAPELCKNYRDDNCDDVIDERDPTCTCPSGQQKCGSAWECGNVGAVACTKGCCDSCGNNDVKPNCSWGGGSYCAQRYGTNPLTGCNYGWLCDNCGNCPQTVDPVCAVNGSTYDNACLLGLRFTKQIHTGACLQGEGLYCDGPSGTQGGLDGGCGPSGQLYCRASCPNATSCGYKQCTKKGACLVDSDCPAGLPAPTSADCDGGTPSQRCVANACVTSCQ